MRRSKRPEREIQGGRVQQVKGKPPKARARPQLRVTDAGSADQVAVQTEGRDRRLPPVGTAIVKRDRYGASRCECTVEETGIRYDGVVYRSLSAAATAAAAHLGIKGNVNGFVFWGLTKPGRTGRNPTEVVQALGARYRQRVEALLAQLGSDDARARVCREVAAQAESLTKLVARTAA